MVPVLCATHCQSVAVWARITAVPIQMGESDFMLHISYPSAINPGLYFRCGICIRNVCDVHDSDQYRIIDHGIRCTQSPAWAVLFERCRQRQLSSSNTIAALCVTQSSTNYAPSLRLPPRCFLLGPQQTSIVRKESCCISSTPCTAATSHENKPTC